MTGPNDAALTSAMRDCLEQMESFASGSVPLIEFYAYVDLFEEWIRNIDGSTLDARVLKPIAASLGGICIMSRGGDGPIEEMRDYVRDRLNELDDAHWRSRVASGWWPYGSPDGRRR